MTPLRLFKAIVDGGLEFKGQPVKLDIVSTTPATIDEHFRNVIHTEITDPNASGTAPTTWPSAPTTVHPAPGRSTTAPRC